MQPSSLQSCKIPVREIIMDSQDPLHVGFGESESHFDVFGVSHLCSLDSI